MTFSPEARVSHPGASGAAAVSIVPTLASKRARGVYYTRGPIAAVLSDWAVRSSSDEVLEPSFGRGHLVEALASTFKNRYEQNNPYEGIYGFDSDESLFAGIAESPLEGPHALAWMTRVPNGPRQFLCKSFLKARPDDFGSKRFIAAVGNPPYVPHHALKEEDKRDIACALSTAGVALDGKASLWAPFVVHATTFLRKGARMAWVLPSSFLHAEYAEPVRQLIASSFRRSLAVTLGQRLFQAEGAAEATVVVLAEGWRQGGGTTRLAFAEDVDGLRRMVDEWSEGFAVGQRYDDRPARVMASEEALGWMDRLGGHPLGEVAHIKIGVVTGDNRFFVINKDVAASNGIPRGALRPILAASSLVPSIDLSEVLLNDIWEGGGRCFLVHADRDSESWDPAVGRYVDTYSEDKRKKNVTFGKRDDWACPDDGFAPDAFLPYMYQRGPRLIVNTAGINATNNVHRVYLKRPDPEGILARRVALSMVSTFGQLSAEFEGRSYGAGVLKLEPSEAKRLRVLLPDVPSDHVRRTFNVVDQLLARGEADAARATADEVVLESLAPLERGAAVGAMMRAVELARERRWGTKP